VAEEVAVARAAALRRRIKGFFRLFRGTGASSESDFISV
jgi:hypothetical protein